MNDILQEIKHDMAEEKYQKIFLQHGKKLIIGAVVILVAVSVKTVYWNIQEKKSVEVGTLFVNAFDSSDASNYDAIIAKEQKGYSPLATLMKAGLLNSTEKYDEAAKTLDGLTTSSYDKAFMDIAKIDKAYVLIQKKGDKEAILKLLDETSVEGAPFWPTAMELKASYLLSQGEKNKALPLFAQLAADTQIPATIQERAKNILGTTNE